MNARSRDAYVISDLHLGGAQPAGDDPEDRGFRICTHVAELTRFISALAQKPEPVELIVNGDTVDFLAEELEGGGWSPFIADGDAAARTLDRIVDRDREMFKALGTLVGRGHRLTILLGNHDLELALPAARRRLADRIGITGTSDFQFIYDGEAYAIGGGLIEHGNRYDPFNAVDHDGLRRVRSLQSRRQRVGAERAFAPPAGSRMVAEIVNPIKADYRLIDLLKPETGAMLPVLIALEPGYRRVFARVAALGFAARRHRVGASSIPSFAGDIASGTAADPLTAIVRESMPEGADLVLDLMAAESAIAGDIAARDTIDRAAGLARLLASGSRSTIGSRLPALLAAVRSLQNDATFSRDAESFTDYLAAARDLAGNGFRFVIFGHTHAARDIDLTGARYLNTGTWADMIRFPVEILSGPEGRALDGLRAFVEDMGAGRLRAWTTFCPTYVKLTIDEEGIARHITLHDYLPGGDL